MAYTWLIKQDGYIIGQASGIDKAVKMLRNIIKLNGDKSSRWIRHNEGITVEVDNIIYTIERG